MPSTVSPCFRQEEQIWSKEIEKSRILKQCIAQAQKLTLKSAHTFNFNTIPATTKFSYSHVYLPQM